MKKLIKRFTKFVLLPILTLIIIIVAAFLGYRSWVQHSIKDRRTIVEANGIEILEEVEIGGIKQWIQVRGKDRNNPILLFLHGGPGSSFLAMAHAFQDSWEEKYTVVQWEQRGAGKSYNKTIPRSSMTLDQMNADTIDMVQYLRKRFNKEKIFLLGHSWGSVLGVYAIKSHPEWFYAYVGVGQVVNEWEGEKISYEYCLRMAREHENGKALRELLSIAPYPSESMFDKTMVERKWLGEFGGVYVQEAASNRTLGILLFSAPEYSIYDCWRYIKGAISSGKTMEDVLLKLDITTLGYNFQVPVFFFSGRHDYNVPANLTHDYFEKIQAPFKDFVWFENSAHFPMLEEPDKFSKELIERVLPLANKLPDHSAQINN
ncbi:MAG: alpha/beta hydrolase [Desulfobacteraceae bacterium]|jgi:pimeloyl-ACP methyl ester carboxylesterase